jgi:hypothetical protein
MDHLQFLGLSLVWVILWLWCCVLPSVEGLSVLFNNLLCGSRVMVVVVMCWESFSGCPMRGLLDVGSLF